MRPTKRVGGELYRMSLQEEHRVNFFGSLFLLWIGQKKDKYIKCSKFYTIQSQFK